MAGHKCNFYHYISYYALNVKSGHKLLSLVESLTKYIFTWAISWVSLMLQIRTPTGSKTFSSL